MDMLGPDDLLSCRIDYSNCPIVDAIAWCYVVRKDEISIIDGEILCWWLTIEVIKAIKGKLDWLPFGRTMLTGRKPERIPTFVYSGIVIRYAWLLILCPANGKETTIVKI